MKILAIGNSFSQDAVKYLHGIALADHMELKVVNLFIGGCSLKTHWENALLDAPLYLCELNGESTEEMISIKKGLESDEWDIVTLQQVSHQSIRYETYQPYLQYLSDYVKKYSPHATQMIHQTWAYEQGSERLTVELGYSDQIEMYLDLKSAYEKAAHALGGLKIIPCGASFQKAIAQEIGPLHRDTFHASLGIGRYLLSAVWYETLTGNSILNNTFNYFEEAIDGRTLDLLKACAHEAVQENRL